MSSRRLDVQIHRISPLLSQTIRQCRRALNFSTRDFADKIHKTPEFVSKLERAEVAFTSQTLEDCARILGFSVGELIDLAVSEQLVLMMEESEDLKATTA